jgi:hypothetical protein
MTEAQQGLVIDICGVSGTKSAFRISLVCDTCPAHLFLVDSVAVIFVEQYNLRSSSLCIFHPSVIVSPFDADVLVITDAVECSCF